MEFEISPLDGRYKDKIAQLGNYFSEFALMRARTVIESFYILALYETKLFGILGADNKNKIKRIINDFTIEDYRLIKQKEKLTNHDVKSVELFLQDYLNLENNNIIHIGLTSEDVNNLAYSLLLKQFLEKEFLPKIKEIENMLIEMVGKWKSLVFCARTHGQKASPTTIGKEFAVFLSRIHKQVFKLEKINFAGKLNGATGNYSAIKSAFPDYNWIEFSNKFVLRLKLAPNLYTTQIESHDNWAEFFNIVRMLNNIVIDLDQDCWEYISRGYLIEKTKEEEVGSSTMPHKVNPINFENAEGNLLLSNALLSFLSDKLCRSRMQRDLSDSTVQRNMGVALSHSYLALKETLKGLNKLDVNSDVCKQELQNSLELLAEPIQSILRTTNIDDPYGMLKGLSRGKKLTDEDLSTFIDELNVDKEIKKKLHALKIHEYIGEASKLCDMLLEEIS
ncbi:MAG: adenylosuccinate lyase [Pseudomonadota bacterium]